MLHARLLTQQKNKPRGSKSPTAASNGVATEGYEQEARKTGSEVRNTLVPNKKAPQDAHDDKDVGVCIIMRNNLPWQRCPHVTRNDTDHKAARSKYTNTRAQVERDESAK